LHLKDSYLYYIYGIVYVLDVAMFDHGKINIKHKEHCIYM